MTRPDRRFDPDVRKAFLEKLREGASVGHACRMTGCSKRTVFAWLKAGREGARPEYRAFARAYEEAAQEQAHEARRLLGQHAKADIGGNGSVKATLAILRARDPLAVSAKRVELARLKIGRDKDKVDLAKAQDEAKLVAFRVAVAEALAEKASKKDDGLIFGLTSIIGDESITVEARTEIARWAIRNGMVVVERADLTKGPASQCG